MALPQRVQPGSHVFSSSPAFGTPLHPLPNGIQRAPPPPPAFKPQIATILPILLPPPTLRPLAFRTFTKKHNLTLNASALQGLATFIGRHCGSSWREEGTGEKVLEEVAKIWKAENGPVIVEDGDRLQAILKTLEGCMTGGRIGPAKSGNNLSRQASFAFGNDSAVDLGDGSRRPSLHREGSSFGLGGLKVDSPAPEEHEEASKDPRSWLNVVSAFEQPRFTYHVDKKHFLSISAKPTMFPAPAHKTAIFKERYNIIHQRLLRNPAFQAPSTSTVQPKLSRRAKNSALERQFYKITPIANLLGRGSTSHLLLGMLVIAPTGTLALNDPSGSISLDLQHAGSMQEGEPYFCPGMIVLVDGVYEEDWAGAGSSGLGNTGGVGGTIGGRFVGFEIGGPPVEKRDLALGINVKAEDLGGGFGWTDFLGQGSERAIGSRMRRLEQRLIGSEAELSSDAERKIVMISELNLDNPVILSGLREVLEQYAANDQPPMTFVLMGDFSSKAAMAGSGTGSIEYKELFNELAAVMADFPTLLRKSTWVFVPGDNDAWASSFSAGAGTVAPRAGVPDLFTNRIKRAFATAKTEGSALKKEESDGEAIWTSNPARLSMFGPAHEVVLFRDDIAGRLRRNAVRIGQAAKAEGQQPQPASAEGEDIIMSGALPSTEDVLEADSQLTDGTVLDSPMVEVPVSEPFGIQEAKRLILSLLPQSTLSPFPLTVRPTHWDYTASALSLYPLPHTLVLADAESPPFALTFEGCHVINPGRLVEGGGRRKKVQWVEYDAWAKRGMLKELYMG
ncbi:DNA polymerase epsilon subunit B [Fulvia fulva]|uniref:DNA polymerase epsilon subunit B n=1 Tax=Passalora fulva TaxID=5499 RepID=A0A9Q8PH59_PASFU|nr:DNA polymerase epsilon subunit B [Fulvia fulva]UJO22431.1 DNA polymerase epsilon subunit B [Fulvia fulva]